MKTKDLSLILPLFLGILAAIFAIQMIKRKKWFALSLLLIGAICLLGASFYRIYDLIEYRELDNLIDKHDKFEEMKLLFNNKRKLEKLEQMKRLDEHYEREQLLHSSQWISMSNDNCIY